MKTEHRSELTNRFIPGGYWTRALADAAVARMSAELASPPMQALFEELGRLGETGADPAATAAQMAQMPGEPPSPRRDGSIDPAACIVRRANAGDVQALAQLIIHGELPPFFIEPFVEGFCVVEHSGELIACGGLEPYGAECGVIRSVVTHESARGIGLGALIARLLIDEARAYGAKDIYLFTMHAVEFWEHMGFQHLELPKWRAETHANWQYTFVSHFPKASGDVSPMWMPA